MIVRGGACWLILVASGAAAGGAACQVPPEMSLGGPACERRGPTDAGPVGWFQDRTFDRGLTFDYQPLDFRSGAVAVADMDGDGRLDVIAVNRQGGGAVFRNTGGLTFARWSGGDVLAELGPLHYAAAGDLDGDGDRDLVAAGDDGVWLLKSAPGRDGALALGDPALLDSSIATEHVVIADLDHDQRPDLYLSNLDHQSQVASRNRLLRNLGAGAFERVAGADSKGLSWASTVFDFDRDLDLDIYVANDTLVSDYGQPRPGGSDPSVDLPADALYRSRASDGGGLVFDEVAAELGLDTPRSSMGGQLADLDGSGSLDLYIPDFGDNDVLLQHDGVYQHGEIAVGLAGTGRRQTGCQSDDHDLCALLSWGSHIGDFNIDGYDDILVVNGESFPGLPPAPPQLFLGPAPFDEVDAGLGCFEGGGLVASDLDRDGDLDLVVSTREGPLRLLENTVAADPSEVATDRLGLTVALRAPSGTEAGATVRFELASGRNVLRAVSAGGIAFSQAPAEVHVGLGRDRVQKIRVRWPSGKEQVVRPAAAARWIEVVEPPA